jgi:hypothetical protein
LQEIKVKGKRVINVTLKASTKSLDEVVVVGYGIRRKRDITGSVAMVSASGIRSNGQGYISGPPRNEVYNREGYVNIKENEFDLVYRASLYYNLGTPLSYIVIVY